MLIMYPWQATRALFAGDLKAERVQRFASYDDLEKAHVTVEEREEYEQHLKVGTIVYAGVDYEAILREVPPTITPLHVLLHISGVESKWQRSC